MPDNECLAPLDWGLGWRAARVGGKESGIYGVARGYAKKTPRDSGAPLKNTGRQTANISGDVACPSSLSLPETNTVIVFALSLIFEIFFFLEIEISCYKCFDINYGFEDRIIVILIRFN